MIFYLYQVDKFISLKGIIIAIINLRSEGSIFTGRLSVIVAQ